MSGTMSQADLVADLKLSLMDAAGMFTGAADADFIRQLGNAAADLPRLVPEFAQASLTLVAGQSLYDAPADLRDPDKLQWGEAQRNLPTWDPAFPGKLPQLLTTVSAGVRKLRLSPAPCQDQITLLGAAAPFTYTQAFVIDAVAANTTVPVRWRNLLLLRAQAEAMKELAVRGIAKPVQLRDGVTQGPRNMSPSVFFGVLMEECERQAA